MRNAVWSFAVASVLLISCGPPVASERGAYVFGHEVRSFQPCGGQQVFWVKADEAVNQELRARHGALTAAPYQAIFVIVEGAPTDEVRTGFAADYDGVFRVERLLEASPEMPADCLLPGPL